MEIVFDYRPNPSSLQRENERLEQLVACFQMYVGHELPNQLVPIQAFARMLLEQPSALDEEGRLLLDRLAALAQRADSLARRLADIGRLLREPPWGPPAPLRELFGEAVAAVNVLGIPPGVEYDVQNTPATVRASRRLLLAVLVQLLGNAGRSMAGQTGVVRVGGTSEAGGTSIIIQDAGRGFSESQAGLFEPFAAGRFPGAAGPGLGLFLVRQAAARWGGVLSVRSQPGLGSTFALFIPEPQEKSTE
jgi:signal transduction histidine kinase